MITDPPQLTSIPPEEQQEALEKKWLVPIHIKYVKGMSFGERSLYLDKDTRAGSAIATRNSTLLSLSKEEY